MPSARESLLNAALEALAQRPWSAVRMVDVAAAAGLSRQTLYNEFGGKDGLARALVQREADAYLRGVDQLLAAPPDRPRLSRVDDPAAPEARAAVGESSDIGARRWAALAEWTVQEAAANRLLRALLTGCWDDRLPEPRPVQNGRAFDAGPVTPGEMVALVRDRLCATLTADGLDCSAPRESPESARGCEFAVRLTLSLVVAPVGDVRAATVRPLLCSAVD
ncbi:TetR/AcrR family transcriptional regulator [Streptomyces sp. NPDC005963]|uniref:TetR/AcrR family transcriptional regulator n=1 Tax=Streptomyces sp. NPDC005963 TaxID=3156721 RepID=UPI0033C183D4